MQSCCIDKHRGAAADYRDKNLLSGLYTHKAAGLRLSFKLNFSAGFGEQGMIIPQANIITRMEHRSTLADENLTGLDELAREPLHTKTATYAIAPVRRATACFFMRHV
jgi:hypothetical protein